MQVTPPRLGGPWTYGVPVPDRGTLGTNVQIDHPIRVMLRIRQRTAPSGVCYYSRSISSGLEEQGVLVETGRGLFHTELGKLQSTISNNVLSGQWDGEAALIESTQQAYDQTSLLTGAGFEATARDGAILSNQNVLNVSTAETVNELLALPPGGTTMTDESVNQCFADTFQATPEATNTALQSGTEELASEASPLTGELAQMEGELMSSEAGLMSRTGSLVCEAAGPAMAGIATYFSVKGAIADFEEGDDVGGTLNVLAIGGVLAPEVGIVAAPAVGTWEGIKSGGKILKMEVDCANVEVAYLSSDDPDPWDPNVQACLGPFLGNDAFRRVVNEDIQAQGGF
jgi:hypothetical protein